MNRIKRSSDAKNQKKVNKLVKKNIKSSSSPEAIKEGDALFLKSIKAKYLPKKTPSKANINKKIATKLKKYRSKHAKRTTPGEVTGQENEFAPAFAKIEGVRWNKIVTLQSTTGARKISKKRLKQSSRERNTYRKAQ